MVRAGSGHRPAPVSMAGPRRHPDRRGGDAKKIWKAGKSFKRYGKIFSGEDPRRLTVSVRATPGRPSRERAAARLPPPPFLIPAVIFGSGPLFESLALGLDGLSFLRMFAFGLVQRRLRLVDGLLPALVLLPLGSSFLRAFALAAPLLPFVGERGLPLRRLVDGPGLRLLRPTACPSSVFPRRPDRWVVRHAR